MEISHRDADASLRKKGFSTDAGGHIAYKYTTMDGKLTSVATHMSHGSKPLNDFHAAQMARQLSLSKQQFLDLVRCPLSREKLEEILTEKGKIR